MGRMVSGALRGVPADGGAPKHAEGRGKPARASDSVAALERAWERYRERAKGIMAGDLKADTRHHLQDMLLKHSQEIAAIG